MILSREQLIELLKLINDGVFLLGKMAKTTDTEYTLVYLVGQDADSQAVYLVPSTEITKNMRDFVLKNGQLDDKEEEERMSELWNATEDAWRTAGYLLRQGAHDFSGRKIKEFLYGSTWY